MSEEKSDKKLPAFMSPSKVPQNAEHFEANQMAVTKSLDIAIKNMSLEDRKKIEAVRQAVKILTDNDVIFYLFPYLNSTPDAGFNNKPIMWQWNSIMNYFKYDEKGHLSKDDVEFIHDVNGAIMYAILATFFRGMEKPEKVMETMRQLLFHDYKRLYPKNKK